MCPSLGHPSVIFKDFCCSLQEVFLRMVKDPWEITGKERIPQGLEQLLLSIYLLIILPGRFGHSLFLTLYLLYEFGALGISKLL
jgi:hypothetical protein